MWSERLHLFPEHETDLQCPMSHYLNPVRKNNTHQRKKEENA